MFPFLPNRLVFGGKVDRLEGKIVVTTGQTKSPIPLQFLNATSSHPLTELSDELENEKIEATFEIRSREHSWWRSWVNCPSSRLLPLQTASYLISYENDSSLHLSAEELEDLGEIRIEKLKEVWTQVLERRRLYERNTERVGTGLWAYAYSFT